MDTKFILDDIKKKLLATNKEKIIGISTTADLNNPPFITGSIRETETTLAGTIILRDAFFLDLIIEIFDGFVDYFMVDCEEKNELYGLQSLVFEKVKKSKVFVYKPNDFTVESLDVLIAILFGLLVDKKVLIVGAGNIGSKIALKLCERGASVFVSSRDQDKSKRIIEGLNLIKRSTQEIKLIDELIGQCDLLLSCTPGVKVVDKEMVSKVKDGGKIIDVGNRTIYSDAISFARDRGIELLSLSSFPGYQGMISNWLFQRSMLQKPKYKSYGTFSVIIPGVLGARGDILLDDVESPSRVFGVCDGEGGLSPKSEGLKIIESYVANGAEIGNIDLIYKLYQ